MVGLESGVERVALQAGEGLALWQWQLHHNTALRETMCPLTLRACCLPDQSVPPHPEPWHRHVTVKSRNLCWFAMPSGELKYNAAELSALASSRPYAQSAVRDSLPSLAADGSGMLPHPSGPLSPSVGLDGSAGGAGGAAGSGGMGRGSSSQLPTVLPAGASSAVAAAARARSRAVERGGAGGRGGTTGGGGGGAAGAGVELPGGRIMPGK